MVKRTYKKQTKRQTLMTALKTEHSLYIRSKGNRCVVCGSYDNLQCGHIFTCSHLSTRWDLEYDGDCHIQCGGCNLKHENDAYPYYNWYINKFGKDKFDKLHIRHMTIKKYSIPDLEDLLERIKQLRKGDKK